VPVTPGLLVAVLLAAAAATFGLRDRWAWSPAVGFAGLVAAVAMAVGLDPLSSSTMVGLPLAASPYARLVVIAASCSVAGVAVVAALLADRASPSETGLQVGTFAGTLAGTLAGLLAGLAAVAFALFASVTAPGEEADLAPAGFAGPASSMAILAAATALLAPLAARSDAGDSAGTGWLRLAAAGGALAALGVLWPSVSATSSAASGAPDTTGAMVGLLLVTAGLAIRGGGVPLLGPVARLITATRLPVVALSAAWLPATMALAAVAWSAAALGPLAGLVPPDGRNAAAALGVATLLIGGVVAALQTNPVRLLAWSLVGDAGLLVLAIAPEGPDLNDAARILLLVNAVARTGLVAWVLVVTHASRSMPGSSRGWILRLPAVESVLLLVGLALMAAASYGLPGWPAATARLALVQGAVPEPFTSFGLVAAWIGLLAYARLGVEGFRRTPVRGASVPAAPASRAGRGVPAENQEGGRGRATRRTTLAAATALLVSILAFSIASGIVPLDVRAGDPFRALPEIPGEPVPTDVPTDVPAP